MFPVDAIVTYNICGAFPKVPSAPGADVLERPEKTPLVLLLNPSACVVENVKSQKSVALPVEAIVI